jgi:hypothetical protein
MVGGNRRDPRGFRRGWPYAQDLDGFLHDLGTSRDDPTEVKRRIEIVLLSQEGAFMPKLLRQELTCAGLLDPKARLR